MSLTQILDSSAEAANLLPQDQAALELARIYARSIETAVIKGDAKSIADTGAKLLSTLTALGMTQAGRAVKAEIKGGVAAHDRNSAASTFEQIRSGFNTRATDSSAVDTATA